MTLDDPVADALRRLVQAEHDGHHAIDDLLALGIRTRASQASGASDSLRAVLGLMPPSKPGYDLVTREGKRVQVKTLRCTPENLRGSIGVLREPYDLLVALRLNDDFTPLQAMEIPREVVEQYIGQGRVGWQKRLAAGSRVRVITGEALLTASRSLR